MEWITELAQRREIPILAAFGLGLLTAISPCPLATNITATSYIARRVGSSRAVLWGGIWYTLGRVISYAGLAIVLLMGASKFKVAKLFQANGEKFLAPILIIVGLMMLNVIKINFGGRFDLAGWFSSRFEAKGGLGAFLLGLVFALAFCPTSGALFFGSLIPMALKSNGGIMLPIIYAIGTALPVLLFTYLLAFGAGKVGRAFNLITKIEKVMRIVAGVTFILAGVYYALIFLKVI